MPPSSLCSVLPREKPRLWHTSQVSPGLSALILPLPFLVGTPSPQLPIFICDLTTSLSQRTALVAQMVKSLPAMRETWDQFLVQEDPQEKGMATHFSIIACRIPWTEEPGGLQSMGLQRVTDTLSYPRGDRLAKVPVSLEVTQVGQWT